MSIFLFFYFHSEVYYSAGYLFCWLSLSLVIWPRLVDLFVYQMLLSLLFLCSGLQETSEYCSQFCQKWSWFFPLFSSSFIVFSRSLGTVSSALVASSLTVNFMFHRFFSFLSKSKILGRITGVWVIASLCRYPGLFWVFYTILIIL